MIRFLYAQDKEITFEEFNTKQFDILYNCYIIKNVKEVYLFHEVISKLPLWEITVNYANTKVNAYNRST